MKRVIITILVVIAMGCGAMAQTVSDGDWKKVDKLVEQHLYDSAFHQSENLLVKAIDAKQSKEILIATAMKAEIATKYQENFQDSIGSWLLKVESCVDNQHHAIWHVMMANYIKWYSTEIRYGVSNNKSESMMMWSKNLRESEMMSHIDKALESSELLKNADTKDYTRLLLKRRGKYLYGIDNEPTLLDVALRYAYEISKSIIKIDNVWSDSSILLVSPINEFSKVEVSDIDSILVPLKYFQQLEKRHMQRGVDEQIDLYCERLDYMRNFQDISMGIIRGIKYYSYRSNNKQITMLYAMLAEYYDRKKNYVEALDLCNKALKISKDNAGGVRCGIVKDRIEETSVALAEREESLPNEVHYVDLKTRNVPIVYLRLYDVSLMSLKERNELRNMDEISKKLNSEKIKEWRMAIDDKGEHKEVSSALIVDKLPKGAYLLVACENAKFEKNKISSALIIKTDLSLETQVGEISDGNRRLDIGYCGMIRNRKNGKPMSGVEVGLRVGDKVVETATTDANGYYHFSKDIQLGRYAVVEIHDGDFVWDAQNSNYWTRSYEVKQRNEILMFHDKPVYKLGETIQWSFVVNKFDGEDNREVLNKVRAEVSLFDVNLKKLDSLIAVTDAYGRASGSFELPNDGLNGVYMIEVKLMGEQEGMSRSYIKVLAYKQPKFMVSLLGGDEYYKVGQNVKIKGIAKAYNGATMGGSIVKYRIDKRNGWFNKQNEESGQLVCDNDGEFEIPFIPKANILNGDKIEYELTVMVTDLNGETQEITKPLFAVKKDKRNIVIYTEDDLWEWNELKFGYTSLYGDIEDENVNIKVEQLQQPIVPYLRLPLWDKDHQHSISNREFEKLFPQYAYDVDELDPMTWKSKKCVLDTMCKVLNEDERVTMKMPELETGVYKITITDKYGTKGVKVVNLSHLEAQKCLSSGLLWCDVEHDLYEVGLVARVRIGTRFRGVNVVYNIMYRGKVLEQGNFVLNNEMKMLMIPVMQQHLGGFTVNFSAVYENVGCNVSEFIEVPYSEKENSIELVTFRDKLEPGEKEQWTLKCDKSNSAMILTMYDEALSVYENMSWDYRDRLWIQNMKDARFGMYYRPVWNNGSMNRSRGYDGVMYSKNAAVGLAASPENAYMEYDDEMNVDLRTDLNSNAFFMPNLISDSTGKVSVSFEAPDLLTQWRMQGFGWTKDMAIGDIEKQVITQKDLMVIPNVPRFLRQGDRMNFSSKVTNLSENDESVLVEFWLMNAENDSVVMNDKKMITIASGEGKMVNFEFKVPDNMYVAKYKIVAKGGNHSDGEQGQIAVLSNRQMVTESMSMYVNGRDTKTYNFKNFKENNSETLQHYGMTLEFTSNPMWYIMQTLPYVAELKSPSMMYLMNQLYMNQVGRYIIDNNPVIEEVFEEWSEDEVEGNLNRNENLKQASIEETPWVSQAKNEEEQRHQIMEYFDKTSMNNLIDDVQQKLINGQREDGGWSWIAGDRKSNRYVTEYILRQMGELKRMGVSIDTMWNKCLNDALNYCDKEAYEYYEQLMKKHKDVDATDIYYLYMRSYYADSKFENVDKNGYKYFYQNALKNYKNYNDLYTRAQLALIFYRHGDRNEAMDIAQSLKGSALYSDEMGMYWRDNIGGYYWYNRPIETQTMLINVFDEILNDKESVGKMQQWLLKQKQTTHWGNDVATANAVEALLKNGGAEQLADMKLVDVKVGNYKVKTKFQKGTGYTTESWSGECIDTSMGNITLKKATKGPAWGSIYWQYFENLDKIKYSEMGIKMDKRFYRVELNGELIEINKNETLKVGDRVRVRILIDCDRNLEYLQLKDQRASAFEPAKSESGWRWNWSDGLFYYVDVRDACNIFYINRLNKGKYILEYDMWVTNSGDYSCGIASMQCMYAPEFRCNTQGVKMKIK